MQGTQQSLAAHQAQQQAQQQAQAQAPPPDVLYNNGLRDYNGAKNDLAIQEFSDYIKFYPNTDLAGNAYFYLPRFNTSRGTFSRRCRITIRYSRIFPAVASCVGAIEERICLD